MRGNESYSYVPPGSLHCGYEVHGPVKFDRNDNGFNKKMCRITSRQLFLGSRGQNL